MNRKDSGFTLIELFIIVSLISIMTAIIVPNFMQWVSNYRLKNASFEMRSLMQVAKLAAVKEKSYAVISFDVENNSYKSFLDNGESEDTQWTWEEGEKIIREGTMPDGIDLYEASFSGGVPYLRFNSRGFPNGWGGHVYMRNDQNRVVEITLSMMGNINVKR